MATQPVKTPRQLANVIQTSAVGGTGIQPWGLSGVGATSAYAYAQTFFGGTYECLNTVNSTVSGPVTNPNYPVYGPTYFQLGVDGTCIIQILNTSAALTASASPGMWNHTTSTHVGGLEVSGNFFTSTVGEKFLPVASSTSAGVWYTPNGTPFSPGTFSTGEQQYAIMKQAGPWSAGSAADTSATVPVEMQTVWADLGQILQAQGTGQLESFSDNWNSVPGL